MERVNPPDLLIEGWLNVLGMNCLSQWDVLVFLFRHPTSLVSAEHIARLLGYATAPVVDALERLESLGLVGRSRTHQGVRLYYFTAPTEPPRGDALDQLLTLADSRPVRLFLKKKLQRGERPDPNNCQAHFPHGERRSKWRRKAV
jgi:predicted transcriptional regulator